MQKQRTQFCCVLCLFWYVIERLTSRCSAVNNVYKSGENPDKQGVYINWSSSAQDHLWGEMNGVNVTARATKMVGGPMLIGLDL